MNQVILIGRLTKDPDVRQAGQTSIARFTVAVDDNYAKEKRADFISCVAFGKSAENIGKFFGKGKSIGLTGRIQTGSYEKDGSRVYTTDVIVNSWEFVGSKSDGQAPAAQTAQSYPPGYEEVDDDLPF